MYAEITYAEKELGPYGFSFRMKITTPRTGDMELHLKYYSSTLTLKCNCPHYPEIKACGCPLHHKGPGGSWPIEKVKAMLNPSE